MKRIVPALALALALAGAGFEAGATVITVNVDGSDAIFLAGRSDLVIPPASDPWPGGMIRHAGPTPEEIQETLPPGFAVTTGDVIRLADPAVGGISFFNGVGAPYYGPGGNQPNCSGGACSDLGGYGGISGYFGPEGALVGVFLDDNVPLAGAPSRLDFSSAGLGVNFASLAPALGQVFYIGDGLTDSNVFQQFLAPSGATRLFLGIPDGFGFDGAPGAYDDNDGSYRVRLGINEIPSVPEPATLSLLGLALLGAAALRRAR